MGIYTLGGLHCLGQPISDLETDSLLGVYCPGGLHSWGSSVLGSTLLGVETVSSYRFGVWRNTHPFLGSLLPWGSTLLGVYSVGVYTLRGLHCLGQRILSLETHSPGGLHSWGSTLLGVYIPRGLHSWGSTLFRTIDFGHGDW